MTCLFQEHPDEQTQAIEGKCHICTESDANRFCPAYQPWIKEVKVQFFDVSEETPPCLRDTQV